MVLPPGTILQLMYVKERLRKRTPGTFIEIGVGQGLLSSTLLALGWSGVGLEIDAASAEAARANNAAAIQNGVYKVVQEDWLGGEAPAADVPGKADLVISSMVLEHLDEAAEERYFACCAQRLNPGGLCVLLVPGSMRGWGIEDEIAGHHRRYTFSRFQQMLPRFDWRIEHMAGLTFPLSNILLPLSNWLVARSEGVKRELDMQARTRASGHRNVYGKTVFPTLAGAILNEWALYPFHLLQKAFRRCERALVIYVECVPKPYRSRP
jgi:SAM-dependent methyltransferase